MVGASLDSCVTGSVVVSSSYPPKRDNEKNYTTHNAFLQFFYVNGNALVLQDGVVGKEARCPSQQGEVS